MSFDPVPFLFWPSVLEWLVVSGIFVAAVIVIWLIMAIVVRGPIGGFKAVFSSITDSFADIFSVSFRRVYALANLTFKEAVRRKALLVFVVFAILFMFGAWFLPDSNTRTQLQMKVYVSFVLTAISWLLVPVMLLLACWGLPEDIRLKSLHTVVTKPARRFEIVLGRIIGYSSVGLLLLGLMSVVGYVWLAQSMDPGNKLAFNDRMAVPSLDCRVPVYGELEFVDREGRPASDGLNVGDIWDFRSYVEGATKSRAIWHFQGISDSSLVNDQLNLECMFESFRTTKGRDMSKGLIAQFTLVNNVRERAFYSVAKSEMLRESADFLRSGQFSNAADALDKVAALINQGRGRFAKSELTTASTGLGTASEVLNGIEANGEWKTATVDALSNAASAFNAAIDLGATSEQPDYSTTATAVTELASVIRDNSASLKEKVPRVEVPLPPFEVQEYSGGGNNIRPVDRALTYEGNDEDVVRFLAGLFGKLQDEGSLAGTDGLSTETLNQLVSDNVVSDRNAETLKTLFKELVADGTVSVADGKLQLTDNQSFFALFDGLASEGKISASDGWKLSADLFNDVINDGQLTVSVACQSLTQYLGMARPDLFVRLPDSPFIVGYGKAILAIALMLILIIGIGVTASCFVKGPVATLLTSAFVIFGKPLHKFMNDFVSGNVEGGGLFSAAYRMVYHLNPSVDIEASPRVLSVIEYGDTAANSLPQVFSHIIPNFNYFSLTAEYVENGFDVPWSAGIFPCIGTTLAYLIPCVIIGLFTLKYRELESK